MGRRTSRGKIVLQRLKDLFEAIRYWLARRALESGSLARNGAERLRSAFAAARGVLIVLALLGAAGWWLTRHPPVQTVGAGQVGVRVNRYTGDVSEWPEGSVFVVFGLHELRLFSLRDRTYRAVQASRADGAAPLQSVEGLSLGADLAVRYALDPRRVSAMAKSLPEDIAAEIVEPAVQGVMYKVFARYTVREIFSTKRPEIQQAMADELRPR